MNVILGREAEAVLRAAGVPARIPPLEGFLLGHRRGPVFFVERLLPFGAVFALTEDEARGIGRIWGGAILGVFTLRPGPARRRRVLRPAFCGTLYGEAAGRMRRGGIRLRIFLVDYDRSFVLKPLTVKPGG